MAPKLVQWHLAQGTSRGSKLYNGCHLSSTAGSTACSMTVARAAQMEQNTSITTHPLIQIKNHRRDDGILVSPRSLLLQRYACKEAKH
jgi:hypothetical protein